MDLGLSDSVVLITGASRGIGKGIAEAFLMEKARIILTGRDESRLEKTACEFGKKYGSDRIYSFSGDLHQSDTLDRLKAFIRNRIKRLDHLVCNIGSGRSVPPLAEDRNEFQRMLDINLLGAVGIVGAMLCLLKDSARQADSSPSITFIGSICGVEALGCPVAYASAKSALETYAKNIARPLGRKGIRVNIVSPGNILFPGSVWERKLGEDPNGVAAMLEREVPLNRMGTVEEIGSVVAFLASRRAGFVTGANWVIDGGQTR